MIVRLRPEGFDLLHDPREECPHLLFRWVRDERLDLSDLQQGLREFGPGDLDETDKFIVRTGTEEVADAVNLQGEVW